MHIHKLKSSLLINDVSSLLKEFETYIIPSNIVTIDLGDVSNIDSAGVAFLVELKVSGRQQNCQISFVNISKPVINFCQLYQLTF